MALMDETGMEAIGDKEDSQTQPTMTLHPNPAVVTEILPPASGVMMINYE